MSSLTSGPVGGSVGGQQYLKAGYLKRQKTMKKKWFVLKAETPDSLARLEYFDDEKKWRKNSNQPKRSIILKTCFNINKHKRQDIKQKHVIDLYTKDDCFSIVFETEEELEEWLRPMLFLQHGEELWDGEPPKPIFEHVWQVDVMDRGLGSQSKIRGAYRLCLTDKKLSLIPIGNKLNHLEFSLIGIRRCGATDNFLYIEVGRSSVTGEGDIYMATADAYIASNMNDIIRQAMSNSKKDQFGPKQRMRSSSATESSKPVSMLTTSTSTLRRPPYKHFEPPPLQPLNAVGNNLGSGVVGAVQHGGVGGSSSGLQHQRTYSLPVSPADSSNIENNNYAPMGGGGGSSSIPITHITTIDQVDCYTTRRGSTGGNNRTKRHNRTGSGMTGVLVSTCLSSTLSSRERCDSLPTSRARTTSETTRQPHRPRSSFYDCNHHPASPPSNCSTDSAGSSLSIDETDWSTDQTNELSRYPPHSLTPDEHVIFEENDEWNLPKHSPLSSGIHSESPGSSNDGYVPMHPCDTGYVAMQPLSPANSSVTSGTPSTDIRFSEYHLDKVPSYICGGGGGGDEGRPIRTYSVGSKPQKTEDQSRVRAFSVGSGHSKPIRRNLKASSDPAPLLNSPMGDLMELDFTIKSDPKPYVDMSGCQHTVLSQSPNNDYMIMTSNRNKTISQSSNASDDYLNMDRKQKRKSSKSSTKPITIQQPPKSLNLSPRTTTMMSRKCPVDGRSGTLKIYKGMEDYAEMGGGVLIKTPPTPVITPDYMDLSGGAGKTKDTSEYVNYQPPARSVDSGGGGDYAIMRPGGIIPRRTPPTTTFYKGTCLQRQTSCCSHQVQVVKPGVNMTNHPQSSFKPIEANRVSGGGCDVKSTSPKTIDNLLTRQLTKQMSDVRLATNSETTKQVSSDVRPNSETSIVTQQQQQQTPTRPCSVNSDSNSEPPPSSSDLNSSSSTLVGGSRPPSVSSERELLYVTLEHQQQQQEQQLETTTCKIPYTAIDFVATDELKTVLPTTTTK